MESLLHQKLSGEIRGLLADRLGHINRLYPRVRTVYMSPYGRPHLDALRLEASQCLILGFYAAAAALTERLLAEVLSLELAERAGIEPETLATTDLLERTVACDVIAMATRDRIGGHRLAALHPENTGETSRESAASFLLSVDALVRDISRSKRAA